MTLAQMRNFGQTKFVAIHHSAVNGVPADLAALKRRLASHDNYHGQKKDYTRTKGEFGYKNLLYHYAVAGNGQFVQTQDERYKLYHATDWYKGAESANQWGFAILIEGNYEVDQINAKQINAAATIIANFNKKHNVRLIVKAHREFAAPLYGTGCAGKNLGVSTDPKSAISAINKRVAELMGQTTPTPTPPAPTLPPNQSLVDLVARRDVMAIARQFVQQKISETSGAARKDEWQRLLAHIEKRRGELN